MIQSGNNPVFYTVTNRNYFAGSVAALSSIRTFHSENPIWVFSESRCPLTPEQVRHLTSLPGVKYCSAEEMPLGKVREGWQMKAHAARYLSTLYDGVLIQVDSDVVLCAPLDEVASEAFSKQIPMGGKDGAGPRYPYSKYHHYEKLCSVEATNRDHINPLYISTSVLFLPTRPLLDILRLWSIGVDEAEFGPKGRDVMIYPGYSDQGVFNAILYFSGVKPIALENDLVSQHWTHGRNPVVFKEGAFWNSGKRQLSFHSVGHSPKFWTKQYIQNLDTRPHLKEVYLYWLYHLFDGPCGLLRTYGSRKLQTVEKEVFSNSSPDLQQEYYNRRNPFLKRVIQDYGRLSIAPVTPPYFSKKESPNAIFIMAFAGCIEERDDVHYFYSAVKRLQGYRLLGGKADLIIIANDCAIERYCNPTLAALMNRYRIFVIRSSSEHIRQRFHAFGIDIDSVRLGSIAGLEKGKQEGRYSESIRPTCNALNVPEIYLGRYLLVDEISETYGYEKVAMVDADGGAYCFEDAELPPKCAVDDIWRFDAFTDFIGQCGSTGQEGMHQITAPGLSQLFDLRRDAAALPMFQVAAHWTQGTRAAFGYFVRLFAEEIKRQYVLGYFPAHEAVSTAVILTGRMWPPYGAIVSHSLGRQLEVIHGTADLCDTPFYALKGEDKHVRRFLSPPPIKKRYAVCICGFDRAEAKTPHYSNAAMGRALQYREALQGGMDVHIYTNNPGLSAKPGIIVHLCGAEELTTAWDSRATDQQIVEIHHEACADKARHKDGIFTKKPELAVGMMSKIMAMERTLALGYDGALSADADGMQFSPDTIGSLGRRHIDGIWPALDFHPMLCYIVGTARNDSFRTWLSILREIAQAGEGNEGPLDWIWGPCWMINAEFGARFFRHARGAFRAILDRRIAFHDEHILNCTYNLPEFADNPLRAIRDLGDAAQIGYRELNPKSLAPYKRWSTGALHTGRRFRPAIPHEIPEFKYAR